MRQLSFTQGAQSPFPAGACDPAIDIGTPLVNGLYTLWLPGPDPRLWINAARLSAKRSNVVSEYGTAYAQRRTLVAAAPAGLTIPAGSGGNIATPLGAALACSNEQVGWSAGSIGDTPSWADGANKAITVCLWFRLNRVNGSGYPTICGTSFSTGWWMGLRTGTGAYKAIFRNGSFPYGPFEWGSFNTELRKLTCVTFVLPFDANATASVYHNGVLAVQGTLPNGSGVSGYANVFPLSSSNTGMFAEIFGLACWTRALFPEEIRDLVAGPRALLEKRQTFLYAPLLAFRNAEIVGRSDLRPERRVGLRRSAQIGSATTLHSARALGFPRSALIQGASTLLAHRRPAPSLSRTWFLRPDVRALIIPAEPRSIIVPRETRGIDA
jgi:hypothetical protein